MSAQAPEDKEEKDCMAEKIRKYEAEVQAAQALKLQPRPPLDEAPDTEKDGFPILPLIQPLPPSSRDLVVRLIQTLKQR